MSSQTMWALVKDKPEVGLTMKRVEIPQVGDNDVKIKIHKTAICGTDVHIYQWNEWAQETIRLGTTAGHEYVKNCIPFLILSAMPPIPPFPLIPWARMCW